MWIDFCQGIPLGLTSGTIPFLLKDLDTSSSAHGYASLGLVSLASWPYNLKLLWSPLVDSLYDRRLGRRKSWMLPMLAIIGIAFLALGYGASELFPAEGPVPFVRIAVAFGLLLVCCATQDIAVDGWALTLLDRNYTKYSSTCQTIGLNAGYFFAFTIYLSLASPDFWYYLPIFKAINNSLVIRTCAGSRLLSPSSISGPLCSAAASSTSWPSSWWRG